MDCCHGQAASDEWMDEWMCTVVVEGGKEEECWLSQSGRKGEDAKDINYRVLRINLIQCSKRLIS